MKTSLISNCAKVQSKFVISTFVLLFIISFMGCQNNIALHDTKSIIKKTYVAKKGTNKITKPLVTSPKEVVINDEKPEVNNAPDEVVNPVETSNNSETNSDAEIEIDTTEIQIIVLEEDKIEIDSSDYSKNEYKP